MTCLSLIPVALLGLSPARDQTNGARTGSCGAIDLLRVLCTGDRAACRTSQEHGGHCALRPRLYIVTGNGSFPIPCTSCCTEYCSLPRRSLLDVGRLCSLLVQMSQCSLNMVSSSPCSALEWSGVFMLNISSLDCSLSLSRFLRMLLTNSNCTSMLRRSRTASHYQWHPRLAASRYLYSTEYTLLLLSRARLFCRTTSSPQRALHMPFLDVPALRVNPFSNW